MHIHSLKLNLYRFFVKFNRCAEINRNRNRNHCSKRVLVWLHSVKVLIRLIANYTSCLFGAWFAKNKSSVAFIMKGLA